MKRRGIKNEEKMGMDTIATLIPSLSDEERVGARTRRKKEAETKAIVEEGGKKRKKEKGLAGESVVRKERDTGLILASGRGKVCEEEGCTAPTSICLVIVYRYEERDETKRNESTRVESSRCLLRPRVCAMTL